ncbi:MAG: P22 phage major capsid protein family protein [Fluviibacter sp.]
MANNNLLTISMITNEALRILQNQLVFTRAVSRQYDNKFAIEGAKIGTTINLRKPPRYVGRTGPALQIESSVETYVPLTLGTQFGVDMAFTTQDLTLNISDFSDRFIKPAVAAIANKIDYDGLQQYLNVYNLVGTPGQLTDGATTQAEATAAILAARARLNQMAAPVDEERHIVVDPTVEVGIVSGLTNLFNPAGTISRIFQKGALGDNTLGFNFAMDQNVGNFTSGSFVVGTDTMAVASQAGGSVQNNAQTAFTLSATVSNGKTLTAGTVFTIPGVYAVNPQNRQSTGSLANFVITSAVTGTGSAQNISVFPTPVFSGQFQNVTSTTGTIPSGNASVISGSNGSSYPNAIAFHKDAFALGTADLILPQGVDMAGRSSADGLSIRLVRQYDINSDQLPCRLDVLYGWSTIYPELACRVTG